MIDDPVPLPPLSARPSSSVDDAIRARVTTGLAPARGPSRARRWSLGIFVIAATLGAVHLAKFGFGAAGSTPAVLVSAIIVAVASFATFGRAGSARVGVGARPPALVGAMTATASLRAITHVDDTVEV